MGPKPSGIYYNRLQPPNKHIPPSDIIFLIVLLKFNFWVACQPTTQGWVIESHSICHPNGQIFADLVVCPYCFMGEEFRKESKSLNKKNHGHSK